MCRWCIKLSDRAPRPLSSMNDKQEFHDTSSGEEYDGYDALHHGLFMCASASFARACALSAITQNQIFILVAAIVK